MIRYNSWHFKSDGRVYKYSLSVLKLFYELQEPEGNIAIEWRVAASKRPYLEASFERWEAEKVCRHWYGMLTSTMNLIWCFLAYLMAYIIKMSQIIRSGLSLPPLSSKYYLFWAKRSCRKPLGPEFFIRL